MALESSWFFTIYQTDAECFKPQFGCEKKILITHASALTTEILGISSLR